MKARIRFHVNSGLYYAYKPDLSVHELVTIIRTALGRDSEKAEIRLPYGLGLVVGGMFSVASKLSGRSFPLSAIRVRKFFAETTLSTNSLEHTGFVRPYSLEEVLTRTVHHEFKGR